MATRTRSSSSASRSTMQREREPMSGSMRRDDMQGGKHGLRKMISDGVRVTAEMPDPRVARITIDIDWQNLVSRVAREVGKKIKRRGGRAASSRTGSRRRSSRSS